MKAFSSPSHTKTTSSKNGNVLSAATPFKRDNIQFRHILARPSSRARTLAAMCGMGAERIELPASGLEPDILPVNYAPILSAAARNLAALAGRSAARADQN